jgi:hypothetical protein
VLSGPLDQVYGTNALIPLLPVAAGLLLTPVAALIYNSRYPRVAATGGPVPLVSVAAAETMDKHCPLQSASRTRCPSPEQSARQEFLILDGCSIGRWPLRQSLGLC